MPLEIGARVGPYEVIAALGAGGMGEVWRARDTRLDRLVALKVLPDAVRTDPERAARFEREAKLLASLNHPHIAAIHGFEEAGGQHLIVMELVEGETLAERLERGPIPPPDALRIARQIADALEAAHEQGIIHRDLKPGNIKVRPDGTVKVLDFGLAKALATDPSGASSTGPTQSPTITSPVGVTGVGALLGTAAYMSPEQARGKPVDKRADIWAFACVLYEMLTGKRVFEGADVSEVLAGIIKSDVDWAALPPQTPPRLLALLKRCLQKDPRQRLRDIGDARIEIDEALLEPDRTSARAEDPSSPWKRLGWIGAAVLTLAAAGALTLGATTFLGRAGGDGPPIRFSLAPPEGGLAVALGRGAMGGSPGPLALSPDGRHLAFVALNAAGTPQIWIRSLEALAPQPLNGTEGAFSPFWSPDSQFIGFFTDGKLKKIAASGGAPAITLCDSPDQRGATWSPEGVILFAPSAATPLMKVSASGGVPVPATVLAQGERGHARPFFLPDGRHFLYYVYPAPQPIQIGSLDSSERTSLFVSDSTNVVYARGHLLFLRDRTLMAQPFDTRRLRLTGEPVPVAEEILASGSPNPLGVFSASDGGVLAYQVGTAEQTQLVWFDRSGAQVGMLGDPGDYGELNLSPTGTHATVSVLNRTQRTRDIWLFDVARGLRSRFSFDSANEWNLVWSPDGSRVVFSADRQGTFDLYLKASSGAGADEVLLAEAAAEHPTSWSSDGRFILFSMNPGPGGGFDIWGLFLEEDRQPFPVIATPFNERAGQFSPDGRWIAYESNENGQTEIFVTAFPAGGARWQVSAMGGALPRWSGDGSEIFYLSPDLALMAASVDGQGVGFQVGAVQPLFEVRSRTGRFYSYDVSGDGQRFLVNTLVEGAGSEAITVVVNWPTLLR